MIAIMKVKMNELAQASFLQSGIVILARAYRGNMITHLITASRPPFLGFSKGPYSGSLLIGSGGSSKPWVFFYEIEALSFYMSISI